MSDPHEGHHHAESDTNQDGVVSMEEAVAGGEEHMAAQAADVEAAAAAEAARVAALPTSELDTSDAGLLSRGMALATSLTSPGGPWHGLPPEAATDPNSADWAENQRWACVQGSFFAATFDGTGVIGDHAENVRAYGLPTNPDGQAHARSARFPSPSASRRVQVGNGIAHDGTNVSYTLAQLSAGQVPDVERVRPSDRARGASDRNPRDPLQRGVSLYVGPLVQVTGLARARCLASV
jgi:hypothetical protein